MFFNVYPYVRPFVEHDTSLSDANTIQHVCSTESLLSLILAHQARVALFGGKHGYSSA